MHEIGSSNGLETSNPERHKRPGVGSTIGDPSEPDRFFELVGNLEQTGFVTVAGRQLDPYRHPVSAGPQR
jgi:hypothetical protein